jgi:hypothetical protein
MAQAGEVEVFRITPEVGKCYEHIEATRTLNIRGGDRKYYSENQPAYVGKFLRHERYGAGNGMETFAFFDDNGKENKVEYSFEGNTCFIEVKCKSGGGMRKSGMRKRSRKSRRKLKTRKNRK